MLTNYYEKGSQYIWRLDYCTPSYSHIIHFGSKNKKMNRNCRQLKVYDRSKSQKHNAGIVG